MQRRFAVFLVLLFCLVGASCIKRIPYVRPPDLGLDGIRLRLEGQRAARRQVIARIKATSYGIKRLMGSVELQVIAQAPDKLYLEARSFFEQPMLVFTSNGKHLSWLDLRDVSKPLFGTESIESTRIVEIFGIPLTAEEVVDMTLGVAPSHDTTIEEIDFNSDTNQYMASFRKKNGRKIHCSFRAADDTILGCQVCESDGNMIYNLQFEDFRQMGLLQVAHRFILTVTQNGESQRLKLVAQELQLNTEKLPESTFRQEAP